MAVYARFVFRTCGGRKITVTGRDVVHARQKARETLADQLAREGELMPAGVALTLVDQQRGKRRKKPNWHKYRAAQGRWAPAPKF